MTKTLMPQGGRGSKEGMGSGGRRSNDGVPIAITIAAKNLMDKSLLLVFVVPCTPAASCSP